MGTSKFWVFQAAPALPLKCQFGMELWFLLMKEPIQNQSPKKDDGGDTEMEVVKA